MGSEASEARCREGRSEGQGGEPEQGIAGGAFNAIALLAEAGEQHLRPKQREINHIKPAQDAVDDGPEYRVVRCIGDGNGERRTKAYAVFRSLDASDVIAISVHAFPLRGLAANVLGKIYGPAWRSLLQSCLNARGR